MQGFGGYATCGGSIVETTRIDGCIPSQRLPATASRPIFVTQ